MVLTPGKSNTYKRPFSCLTLRSMKKSSILISDHRPAPLPRYKWMLVFITLGAQLAQQGCTSNTTF